LISGLSAQFVLAKNHIDFDISSKGNVAASELSRHFTVGVAETFHRIHKLRFFLFIGSPLCVVVAGVCIE